MANPNQNPSNAARRVAVRDSLGLAVLLVSTILLFFVTLFLFHALGRAYPSAFTHPSSATDATP